MTIPNRHSCEGAQKHFSACTSNKVIPDLIRDPVRVDQIIEDKSNKASPWILNQVQNDERSS